MYIKCPKCNGKADLQETKPDKSRLFKCRDKKCGEISKQPPYEPPQIPMR